MIKKRYIKKVVLFAIVGIFIGMVSCSDEDNLGREKNNTSSVIDYITVKISGRSEGDPDDGKTEIPENTKPTPKQLGIPYDLKFDENSVIFISQQTEKIPAFQTDDAIYDYEFIEDSYDATWDEGYNFTPRNVIDPLEWYKISNRGTYGGSFTLFALYFPNRSEIKQRNIDGKIVYSVEEDQSTLENLIKSDILGAYHTTSELFNRLQFRLFHLMTYLRIKLYVPLYDPETKTGFFDDALISANLVDVNPEFAVDWGAIRSSDTEGPVVKELSGAGHIIMYQHPLKDGATREPIEIDYKDFLQTGFFDQPITGSKDKVRVYDFSVLIPMQEGTVLADGSKKDFSETDFLNIILRSNSGAENKFVFNQSMKNEDNQSRLNLTQGVFQYLELYVPRVGNKIICLDAIMVPWNHRETSLPLGGKDEEPGDW